MGGGSTTTSQGTSSTQLPQWVQDAGQDNYGVAKSIAGGANPYYQGPTTVGMTPAYFDALNNASGNAASTSSAGQQVLSGLLNNNPTVNATPYSAATVAAAPTVAAGSLASTNLSPYMNPYINDVVDKSMTALNQQADLTRNANAASATAAGAFGGSRAAVQQGVADAQTAQNAGLLSSQLYSQGFSNAQAAAEGDLSRAQSASSQNAANTMAVNAQNASAQNTASQFDASQNLSAQEARNAAIQANYGLQLSGIQGVSNANNANSGALATLGAAQQANQQQGLTGQISEYNQNAAYPTQQLGLLESALGMTPYDTSTMNSGTSTKTNSPDIASLLLGGYKVASSGFNPFASLGSGS